jgi:hypothetical protein
MWLQNRQRFILSLPPPPPIFFPLQPAFPLSFPLCEMRPCMRGGGRAEALKRQPFLCLTMCVYVSVYSQLKIIPYHHQPPLSDSKEYK